MASPEQGAHLVPMKVGGRHSQVPATLLDLLARHQHVAEIKSAFSWIGDSGLVTRTLSYQQLDRESRAIAAELQSRGARTGDRGLILLEPGLGFIIAFFACVYAGVVAVPVSPPENDQDFQKLANPVLDCEPKFLMTTEAFNRSI